MAGRRDKKLSSYQSQRQKSTKGSSHSWMCVETFNQLSGTTLLLAEEKSWRCLHCSSACNDVALLQWRLLPYGLCSYSRIFFASPSPPLLSIANVHSFKTTFIFLPQIHCVKEPHSAPSGWRSCCLVHLALLLVVWSACPRTGSFFGLACGSINPFFQKNLLAVKVFV